MKGRGSGQHHSARKLFGGHAGKIQRSALAGHGLLGLASVYLHAPHPHPFFRRKNFQLFFFANCAGNKRARDYRPESFHREHAVNGQPRQRCRIFGRNFGCDFHQRLLQFLQSRASERTHWNNRRICRVKKRAPQKILDFQSHHFERIAIHHVRLGEYRDAAANREQAADVKVLAGLRLNGFIRRNHQQHQVNSTHARQHVAHKALMPRHVDKAQAQRLASRRRQFQMRKADINRNAATLLFLQAVGINAGQRLYQRGFAVVDMPCCANDYGLHASIRPLKNKKSV